MNKVIFCNTEFDSISIVDVEKDFVKVIPIVVGDMPVGPHGLCEVNKEIYIANSYNDTIAVVKEDEEKVYRYFSVGPNPTDIKYLCEKLYISCGECNSVLVYDSNKERIDYEIKTGSWPHNLCLLEKEKRIISSNLQDSTITVIDCEENKVIKTVEAREYPSSIKYSEIDNCLYICESNLGAAKKGYIEVLSSKDYTSLGRVEVGRGPMNLDIDNDYLYVSNISDGTITIVDKLNLKTKKTIYIGGMPSRIYKVLNKLYVKDYSHNIIWMLDSNYLYKKAIAIN